MKAEERGRGKMSLKEKMSKKKRTVIALVIAAVLIAAAIVLILLVRGRAGFGSDSSSGDGSGAVYSDESESYDDFEYANGISGFYSDYDEDESPEVCGITLPYEDDENGFSIINIGRYTGEFTEDGSDEVIINALALLVENTGDDMLEFLEILLEDEDGNEYTFNISTLPAGRQCLVMEYDQTIYDGGLALSVKEIIPVRRDESDMMAGSISFSVEYGDDGAAEFTLSNVSDKDYDEIYVCYKTVRDGTYIGGVTYRTSFEDVAAGGSVTESMYHFYEGGSDILIIEEAESN